MMNLIWITSAEHMENYTIRIVFNDGMVKIVDLGDHLDKPVFQPLRDKEFFRSFRLNPFTIEWENGADFAPEFLYAIGQQTDNRQPITDNNDNHDNHDNSLIARL